MVPTLIFAIRCAGFRRTAKAMAVAGAFFAAASLALAQPGTAAPGKPAEQQPPAVPPDGAPPATPETTLPTPTTPTPPTTLTTPFEVVEVSNDPAIKDASDLLDALETADRDLRTLQAGLAWEKIFEIQGDQQTRLGSLYFRTTPPARKAEGDASEAEPPARAFEIRFDKLVIGDRIEDRSESYVFDGQWLVERQPEQKLMIKRQVAPPGERFDPLRVGEGQLPIPIGQKKRDILERFDAELVPVNELIGEDEDKELAEKRTAFVKGSIQIRLTPRAELKESSEFQEIRLWYRRADELPGKPYLPRMARAVNRQADVSLVQLINMKINEALPKDVLDTSEPEGWQVQVRPFRQGE